jgi:polyisoprenoid-binding protein YceI
MRGARLAAIAFCVALVSCAPAPREPSPDVRAPSDFPERDYRQAAAEGQAVYRIDAASSLVVIEVRRGGSLARIGHDHVVASHDVQGYVLPAAGRADLYVPLSTLSVDEPALRAAAHFDTTPSAADIAGTRHNMLVRVLDAEAYPFARVSVRGTDADHVDAQIALHGVTRTVRVPVQLAAGSDRLDVSGDLTLRQTDFGIVPLSILGGAVQVQDALALHFKLQARRVK